MNETNKVLAFYANYVEQTAKLEQLEQARKANKEPIKVDKPTTVVDAFVAYPALGIVLGAVVGFIIVFIAALFGWNRIIFQIISAVIAGLVFILWVYIGISMYMEDKKSDKKTLYQNYLDEHSIWEAKDNEFKAEIKRTSQGLPSFDEEKQIIFDDINQELKIPFKIEWIDKKNYKDISHWLINQIKLKQQVETATDPKQRRELYIQLSDGNLQFFYAYSLRGEAGKNKKVYAPFLEKYKTSVNSNNALTLRTDNEENVIRKGNQTKTDIDIRRCKALLDDNRMEPLIAQIEDVKNTDVTTAFGLFTSTTKLAAKTNAFQQLCKAAKAEYDELSTINDKLFDLLALVRLKAYRNIYLCVDLVGVMRTANAGGNKLTTQKDSVKIEILSMDEVALNTTDINMDVVSNIGNTIAGVVNNLVDNKAYRNFAKSNPKVAAGAAAIAIAQNYLKERSETIEKNNQLQVQLLENFDQIVDGYNYGKGQMMRVIEIIKSIAKANKGVVKIYAELRDKYLSPDAKPVPPQEVIKDMQDLAKATQEYKNISNSKL